MGLRNYVLEWTRDDGETGRIQQRAENGQRARILFLSANSNMTDARVIQPSRSQKPPCLYSVGLGILAPHIYMNGLPDDEAREGQRRDA